MLAASGLDFEVRKPEVDETLAAGVEPERGACELALRKARAVASEVSDPSAFVLAADTIVAVADHGTTRLLGKPANEDEARAMLASLSGSRHKVVTGVCAWRVADGVSSCAFERTWVTMRTIAEVEIEAYIASGEWRDKAGGYAIQETADRFVTALEEGGFDNVVGLPVALALDLLQRIGATCGRR